MNELSIEEIRGMETKEIQRTINDLRKNKIAGTVDSKNVSGGFQPKINAEELNQVNKSIARCKTVMNERGPVA